MPATPRLVLHDAALADGCSDRLRVGVSLALHEGRIEWIRPSDDADLTAAEVVDAGGATIVPALVDCHSHLTMQGGSHWIARGNDPPEVLRQVARDNAKRLVSAGVLWARDVRTGFPDMWVTVDGPGLKDAALAQLATFGAKASSSGVVGVSGGSHPSLNRP